MTKECSLLTFIGARGEGILALLLEGSDCCVVENFAVSGEEWAPEGEGSSDLAYCPEKVDAKAGRHG
jgi:hypothetical protein